MSTWQQYGGNGICQSFSNNNNILGGWDRRHDALAFNLFANFNVKPSHLQTSLNDYNSNVCFHVFKPPKFEHTKSLSLCNVWALVAWIPGSIFPTTNLILNAVL